MKTLIITLEYPPEIGGIATHVLQEAFLLPPEETFILAPLHPLAQEFDSQHPWPVIRKKLLWRWFWPRWLKLLFITMGIIRRDKIERIIIHHALPVGYTAKIIKLLFKTPYIIFFHGTDVGLGARKKRRLRFVCAGAEKILVNSQFLKRRLEETLETKQDVAVVYPCPGEEFFKDSDPQKINKLKTKLGLTGKKVLLTVARLADGKGYPHLARLLPRILETNPNLIWLIIGTGPKTGWFINFIQKNELLGTVRFLGALPYQDLPDFYHLADIFVLLTHPDNEKNESWGSAFMEAAAARLPVVAGRAGGVEEAVLDGVTGLVVDTYNEDETAGGITKILNDSNLARRLGNAGYERAKRDFRWSKQLVSIL